MNNYTFVTTFSQKGYDIYGKTFLDSWVKHVGPLGADLLVYHESQDEQPGGSQVRWINLDDDEDRTRFIEDHGSDPKKVGDRSNFNAQSIRFCHKVFAVTDAAKRCKTEWLVWVDSDAVWTDTPPMDRVLPIMSDLTYLGRDPKLNPQWKFGKTWRPICTETGFVGYRVHSNPVQAMLSDMRSYYTTGEIFTRPNTDWHDAKAFDLCRERSSVPPSRWHSYSKDLPGTDVWPRTILAGFSHHNKGDKRKAVAYGSISPE
jgi:hypothetical protein